MFKTTALLNSLFSGYSGNDDFLQIYKKLFFDSIFCMYLNIHYLFCCALIECLQALEIILEYFLKPEDAYQSFPRGF